VWTYPTIDFQTGNLVTDDAPFTEVSFVNQIEGVGSFTGTLPVDAPFLSTDMRNHATRLVTFPCRDGTPFGAFVWMSGPAVSLDSVVQTVQALSVESIFSHRLILSDLVYTNVDEVLVALTTPPIDPSWWAPWAAIPWLRIASSLPTGALISRTHVVGSQRDDGFWASARKDVLSVLTELADNTSNGFEFRFEPNVDTDGTLYVLVEWGDPIRGTHADTANRITFEYPGGNIVSGTYGWDATNYANRVDVIGGNVGARTMLGASASMPQLLEGYPLRVATLSAGSITDQATLNRRAGAELALRSVIQDGYTLVLDGAKDPILGTYGVGDHVTIRIRRGGSSTLDERVVRITALTIKVGDRREAETVTPVLSEVIVP
jgi:hypothetical protein